MEWNSKSHVRRKWSGVELPVGVKPQFLCTEWSGWNWGMDRSGVEKKWNTCFPKLTEVGYKNRSGVKPEWSGSGVE